MLLKKVKGVLIVFTICIVFTFIISKMTSYVSMREAAGETVQYIIDPGHGIPDGGAVGTDGTTEQQLNLAISKKIVQYMDKKNINTLLIRKDENSIFTQGDTIHEKKVSDIRNRIEIASKYKNIPMLSIHLNTFPDTSVYGIQVFYKDGDETSRLLARQIQEAFNRELQPENAKVIKPISKNIYLFSHIENPAILIECGFISNSQELNKLKTEEYQSSIAQIIVDTLAR